MTALQQGVGLIHSIMALFHNRTVSQRLIYNFTS